MVRSRFPRPVLKPEVHPLTFATSHAIGFSDGVAEHVEEGGLEEGVELREGLTTLGPQGARRIQNPRNPLLLVERRERDLESGHILRVEVYPVDKAANAEPSVWGVNPMVSET